MDINGITKLINENGTIIIFLQALISIIVLVVGIIISVYNARISRKLLRYSQYANLELEEFDYEIGKNPSLLELTFKNHSDFPANDVIVYYPYFKYIHKLTNPSEKFIVSNFNKISKFVVSSNKYKIIEIPIEQFDLQHPIKMKWKTNTGGKVTRYYKWSNSEMLPWLEYNNLIRWVIFERLRIKGLKDKIKSKRYYEKKVCEEKIVEIIQRRGPLAKDYVADEFRNRSDAEIDAVMFKMVGKGILKCVDGFDYELNENSKKYIKIQRKLDRRSKSLEDSYADSKHYPRRKK